MSDVAEGIGGAIEGALAGRAVEPKAGEEGGADADGQVCSNCGAPVSSAFCPECGQKRNVHRSLSAIMHDLIHGVLHLDGKFWLTLPLLIFKPGRLTRRYINGERAKFVSPMAMFLFSVFAMFAVFQMVGLTAPTDFQFDGREQLVASLENQAQDVEEQIAAIDDRLEDTTLTSQRRANLEEQRSELQVELNDIRGAANFPLLSDAQVTPPETTADEDGTTVVPLTDDGNARMTLEPTGWDWLDDGLFKKWQENPGLMIYKLQANAYKFSWLLIPLSIPFVWITFFWRRRFKAYDHAIFVTYSLAFMSLLFITASLAAAAGVSWGIVALAVTLIPPIHIYKQLRGTYEIGRFSAFWRMNALLFFIGIIVTMFVQMLIVLGAL